MNVVQLQYFIKVFDCQNYSDAATILSVSPQAVSKGIRALESELGLKLFEKRGSILHLTNYGEEILPIALDALASIEGIQAYAQITREKIKITQTHLTHVAVGLPPILTSWFNQPALNRLSKKYNGGKFAVSRYDDGGTCLSLLLDGQIDIAIVAGQVDTNLFESHFLLNAEVNLLVESNHPLASHAAANLNAVAQYPIANTCDIRYCRKRIDSAFNHLGLFPRYESINLADQHNLSDFLIRKHGVILTIASQTSQIRIGYPAKIVCLSKQDRLSIPFYCASNSNDVQAQTHHAISCIQLEARQLSRCLKSAEEGDLSG
ncbi:LysR family transcriptional regulator [Collinsella sp. AF14-35]|uniref:LysR family transcriptional regulator n=1 Tax=Collinsella sp. AF14-35 TaxID=2292213 RepID=UPI000E4C2EB4|nr:LysR family transcriptional regulator [Collinsella sp. AF14-35]RGV41318.1 LysR family transcriptional regulator [Collinsella sp. AF14-35]